MRGIIGLDLGRNGVKVCCEVCCATESRLFTFPSIVGEWNERKLNNSNYGEKGFEIEVKGIRKFIGVLAENESNHSRYMMTDNKATEDARYLALSALHLSGYSEVTVITGLPVEQHDDAHKREFRELLLGTRAGLWDVSLDGVRRTIRIAEVKVAVEGGGAFWSAPRDGLVRLIDAGSKTVNYVTMRDRRYIYRESGTLPFGFNTLRRGRELSLQDFADQIAGELGAIQWRAGDTVLVSGGRAAELAEALRSHYPLAAAVTNPLYANAIGYYRAGRATT